MATDVRTGSTSAPNRERGMPTGAFSVRPRHLAAIRDAARQRKVSQSEIVREALDRLFPDDADAAGMPPPRRPATPPVSRAARDLAALRGEVADLRRLVERLGGTAVPPTPRVHADDDRSDDATVRDLAALRREVDDLRRDAWQLSTHPPPASVGDAIGTYPGE